MATHLSNLRKRYQGSFFVVLTLNLNTFSLLFFARKDWWRDTTIGNTEPFLGTFIRSSTINGFIYFDVSCFWVRVDTNETFFRPASWSGVCHSPYVNGDVLPAGRGVSDWNKRYDLVLFLSGILPTGTSSKHILVYRSQSENRGTDPHWHHYLDGTLLLIDPFSKSLVRTK